MLKSEPELTIGRLTEADRLLLLACKATLSSDERESLQHLASRISNWDAVIEAACRNRVQIQLARHLSACEIPGAIMVRMKALCLHICQHVQIVKCAFEKALPTILKHHSRPILLRGISYQYTLYARNPRRSIGDIDILVAQRPTFSVAGLYRDHYPVPEDVARALPQGLKIEYHHDLGIYTAWGMRTANIPMDELRHRAQTLRIGPHKVSVLSPEDNLLYLCHHNLTKGLVELYRFVDLHRILQTDTIDWETVRIRAQKYGLAHAVWLNGCVLEQIYGNCFPEGFLARLRPAPPLRRIILRLLDFRSIMHDPHPALHAEHSSSLRNAKRVLVIMLTLARPGNLHKILWAPFNKMLHAIHYKFMTCTGFDNLWRTGKRRLTQILKAMRPSHPSSASSG